MLQLSHYNNNEAYFLHLWNPQVFSYKKLVKWLDNNIYFSEVIVSADRAT